MSDHKPILGDIVEVDHESMAKIETATFANNLGCSLFCFAELAGAIFDKESTLVLTQELMRYFLNERDADKKEKVKNGAVQTSSPN